MLTWSYTQEQFCGATFGIHTPHLAKLSLSILVTLPSPPHTCMLLSQRFCIFAITNTTCFLIISYHFVNMHTYIHTLHLGLPFVKECWNVVRSVFLLKVLGNQLWLLHKSCALLWQSLQYKHVRGERKISLWHWNSPAILLLTITYNNFLYKSRVRRHTRHWHLPQV